MVLSGFISVMTGIAVRGVIRAINRQTYNVVGELQWIAHDFVQGMVFAQIAYMVKVLAALHYARVAMQADLAARAAIASASESVTASVVSSSEPSLAAGLTPPNPGSLVNTQIIKTTSKRILVRAFDNQKAFAVGKWWSDIILPRGLWRTTQVIDTEWNLMTQYCVVEIEEGTVMWVGEAAKIPGLPYEGGGISYYIPPEEFSKIHIKAISNLPTSLKPGI